MPEPVGHGPGIVAAPHRFGGGVVAEVAEATRPPLSSPQIPALLSSAFPMDVLQLRCSTLPASEFRLT